MPATIAYLAQGKVRLKTGSEAPRTIESPYANAIRDLFGVAGVTVNLGSNTRACFRNDFIEIFNNGSSPVNLAGWSVQYGGATATTWSVTNLTSVSLAPGQYYLVQEGQGAGGTTPLPAPDAWRKPMIQPPYRPSVA